MDILEIEYRKENNPFNMSTPHSHDYYELYFLLEGNRDIFLHNSIIQAHPKTFCVIPPFCLHKTEGGPYNRININVSKNFLSQKEIAFLDTCAKKQALSLDPSYSEVFSALLEEAASIPKTQSPQINHYKDSFVKTIFYFLQKQNLTPISIASSSPSNTYTDPLILKITLFINNNYHTEITLPMLCKKFFLSKATLCSHFKKAMHCSIMDYLFRLRLSKAMNYLATTNKSIEEISELCGFSSANYFSLAFKKALGISPMNYRKSR